MIALYHPCESPRAAEIPSLLKWARTLIDDYDAAATDCRLSGVCSRMALEYHLHELCSRIGPPKGNCWHNFAVRLLKAGTFTMDDYRHVRRVNRLAAKAVHGRPWSRERAERLLELVSELIDQE